MQNTLREYEILDLSILDHSWEGITKEPFRKQTPYQKRVHMWVYTNNSPSNLWFGVQREKSLLNAFLMSILKRV